MGDGFYDGTGSALSFMSVSSYTSQTTIVFRGKEKRRKKGREGKWKDKGVNFIFL